MTSFDGRSRGYTELFDYDMPAEDLERLANDGLLNIQPGFDQDEIFDDTFERRSRELNQKPYRGARLTSVVTQRKGPWSGNNQLGFEVPFEADANQQQTILRMDEWGMPAVWSVMLGLTVDEDLIGTDGFNVVAVVNSGCGGIQQQFEVDWHNGAVFSCAMNAINLVARYDDPVGSLADSLRLRACLSPGKLSLVPPTRTLSFSAVALGSSTPIIIPPFAQRVTLMPNETFAPPTPPSLFYDPLNLLRFQRSVTATDGVVVSGDTFLSFSGGIPIPHGARTLDFFNGTAVPLAAQAIFSLAL